ncbi:hypothetical protein ACFLWR_05120 [Chloroflexota bacterium]
MTEKENDTRKSENQDMDAKPSPPSPFGNTRRSNLVDYLAELEKAREKLKNGEIGVEEARLLLQEISELSEKITAEKETGEVIQVTGVEKQAEKEAEKAARRQAKQDEKEAKRASDAVKKAEKEAEKAARKQAKQDEKEARRARDAVKKAEKEAEKAARKQAKQDEKEARRARDAVKKAEKEAEKAVRKQAKQDKKEPRQVENTEEIPGAEVNAEIEESPEVEIITELEKSPEAEMDKDVGEVIEKEPEREIEVTKQVQNIENAELFEGEQNLLLVLPLDSARMREFQKLLNQVHDLRLLLVSGSVEKGTMILVSADKPLPFIHLLREMPPVKQVDMVGTQIQVTIKEAA